MKHRWIAGVLAFAAFTGMMTGCSKTAANSTAETNAPGAERSADTQSGSADETASSEGNTFIITPSGMDFGGDAYEEPQSSGSYF